MQEIYGFTDPTGSSESSISIILILAKECVVCLSEAKDTLVLPCRHLCLCQECANVLRQQGRTPEGGPSRSGRPKCPMCRQVFHSLVHVKLPLEYGKRDSVASRARSRKNLNDSQIIVDQQQIIIPKE